MVYLAEQASPLGTLTLASDGSGLCGLWMEGQKYHKADLGERTRSAGDAKGIPEARAWLEAYFSGEKPDVGSIPLSPRGTEYQRLVWKLLLEVPYGQTTTYGALAERVAQERGRGTSAIAVGGAVGHNPISIIVPCHRVIGADGSLTGYAGGITRKAWLLGHEGADLLEAYVPRRGTAL